MDHFKTTAELYASTITKWITEFETCPSAGPIMGFGAEMRQYLLEKDLAYMETIHHSQCCVWEHNREDEMLIAIRVMILLNIIVKKRVEPRRNFVGAWARALAR